MRSLAFGGAAQRSDGEDERACLPPGHSAMWRVQRASSHVRHQNPKGKVAPHYSAIRNKDMAFDFRYPKPCAPNNTSPTRFRVPRTKGEFMYRTSFRLWLLGSVAAFAAPRQAINGSFSRIVTDKSGSTIPDA